MTRHATRQVRRSAFARRLAEAQAAAGLTTEELARTIGVGLRLVQRWRAAEGEPSGENLIRLARALGRDAEWFYDELEAAA